MTWKRKQLKNIMPPYSVYMKDLDDKKEIELEDLHAHLQRKYDQLLDQGNIEKSDDDNDNKIVKEEKALKTGFKKKFKGKCHIC